ncbi:hypothetical protein [Lacticaseibacillus baoqingensis]|uniref:hypothetical protein n=1 Tax=Lacticaseibacillus baoqingensis TaxID=2486013 RepID=UPI0013DE01A4|nr:hypothetical protein [Lacticaseibacillus baoqingensis]
MGRDPGRNNIEKPPGYGGFFRGASFFRAIACHHTKDKKSRRIKAAFLGFEPLKYARKTVVKVGHAHLKRKIR